MVCCSHWQGEAPKLREVGWCEEEEEEEEERQYCCSFLAAEEGDH